MVGKVSMRFPIYYDSILDRYTFHRPGKLDDGVSPVAVVYCGHDQVELDLVGDRLRVGMVMNMDEWYLWMTAAEARDEAWCGRHGLFLGPERGDDSQRLFARRKHGPAVRLENKDTVRALLSDGVG